MKKIKLKTKKKISTDTIKAGGVIAAVASGVSIITLGILHALGFTDIGKDAPSLVIIIIASIVFAVGLALYFFALFIALRAVEGEADGAELVAADLPVEESLPAGATLEDLAEPAPQPEPAEQLQPDSQPERVEVIEEIYDGTITAEEIAANLAAYSAGRGLKISAECARKIIAAMASSRLVALTGADDGELINFIGVLNGYFGAKTFDGLKDTLSSAYSNLNAITCIALPDASENAETLKQFVNYAAKPAGKTRVTVQNGYTTLNYAISPNVWVFTSVNGSGENLLRSAAKAAAFVCAEFSAAAETGGNDAVKRVNYFTFIKLVELCLDKFAPDEEKFWKKYDKMEKAVKDGCGYFAQNKKRRATEAFASLYLACGGESALDCTAAAHLCAPALSVGLALKDFINAAENVFGEDNAASCKKTGKAVA